MKTVETHLGTKSQHPKWRPSLPQHIEHRRRDPRDRVSHALFPGIGCASAAPGTHALRASGLPGPDFYGAGAAGDYFPRRRHGRRAQSRHAFRITCWGAPWVSQVTPWAWGGWQLRLVSESTPSTLFGIVPVRGKTGFSTAFQTPELSLLLSSLARLHSPRGHSSCVLVHFVK